MGIKGLALGLALGLSAVATAPAQAQGFGAAFRQADLAAMPLIDVQVRRAPPRRVVRRNNNGAAIAGALVGAAIVGGAIIANSEARREQRRREQYYYYGAPQTYYGGPVYVDPRVQRRRAVQPTQYYYEQPRQRVYDPRYRYPDQGYVDRRTREWTWDKNEWDARRQYYRGGDPRGGGVILTPDRETPYTYAPSNRYDGGYVPPRPRRGYDPGPRN
jgi:hypothetical protein